MNGQAAPIRIGMLGGAIIAEHAIFNAIGEGAPLNVVAVAARDADRAAGYARQWHIPNVYPSYAALLAEADVDAVYVPLPNELHHRWVIAALEAGHHVLCEKPIAISAREAADMADTAEARGLLLMEAFHWRAHPVARRLAELVGEGAIGEIEHIDCWFDISRHYLLPNDIRLSPEMGGGSLLDEGCYCANLVRLLAGEPTVVSASAKMLPEGVDGAVTAELALPNGGAATIRTDMTLPGETVGCGATIRGTKGVVRVDNPFLPGWGSRIMIGDRVEEMPTTSSYYHQAVAFAKLLREGPHVPSPARDSVANMRVLDAIRAAFS